MTAFAIGVACLLALAAWLLRPAWRPAVATGTTRPAHLGILGEQLATLDREHAAGQLDAAQHHAARHELQRRVLDEAAVDEAGLDQRGARGLLTSLFIALPLCAIALYAAIGNPAGLAVQPSPPAASEDVSEDALQAMLTTLAKRLETPSADPATDLQGWTMLARAYAGLQRFADADRAYARAIALAPRDPQLLADRADVLAMLQGQRTAGEPERLIAQALQIDPQNLKALALAGSAAFERKDFAAARGYWQQARERAPDGSAFAAGLDRSLAEAGTAGADTTGPAVTATAAATVTANATTGSATDTARITGRVTLAASLATRAAPGDTVFVFARAAEGPRMPLAILRRTVADLPFDFTLDDSSAMSPQTKLSGAARVVVGARISRSGNAMPQAGDLRGESAAIGTRAEGLRLVVDTVQP